MRKANILGCRDEMLVRNLLVGTAVAAIDTYKGETVLLLVNEAINHR